MLKYKQFIIQNNPCGFTLEPMAVRLLEAKADLGKWGDDVIDGLKTQAVKLKQSIGDVYLFPEQIADKNTQNEVVNTAKEWIKNFGCFSLNALHQRFQLRIQNLSTDDIVAFENFLELLHKYKPYSIVWHPPQPPGKTRLVRANDVDRAVAIRKLAHNIEKLINEHFTLTEGQLFEYIPALDSTLLSTIIKEYLPFVLKTENIGCIWYNKKESSLPDDLSEKIVSCIQQIESVDCPVHEDALQLMLSLAYQTNFMKSYHIPDKRSFKNLIEQKYYGEKRKWKSHVFSIVTNENSVDKNEISDGQ